MGNFSWGTVYITGGSSGIGFAIAELVVREGGRVVLLARNEKKLLTAQKQIGKQSCHTQVLDVSKIDAVSDIIKKAIETFGAPDMLINNAGIAHPDHFYDLDLGVFEQTIRTNLLGTIAVTKAAVPFMKVGSRIVNVSSMAGFIGTYGYTSYSASKFGIIGFSQALRNELKPEGIRVSVLCPPDTDTPQLVEENKTKPPETYAISGNAKLMSAAGVAASFGRGVKRNRFLMIPGFSGNMIYLLNQIAPGLVRPIMDSIVRTARKKEGITRRFL